MGKEEEDKKAAEAAKKAAEEAEAAKKAAAKAKKSEHPAGSFKNCRKGEFTICDKTWKKGQSLMVDDKFKEEKAFKLAVSLGHIVENK